MSDKNTDAVPSTEKHENLENGSVHSCNDPKRVFHSDESSIENMEVPTEQVIVQENLQPIEPNQPEENRPVLESLVSTSEIASSHSEQQLGTSDASTETESLEKASDDNEPAAKSTSSDVSTENESLEKASDDNEPAAKSTSSDVSTGTESLESDKSEPIAKFSPSNEISPSRAPSTDKGLEEVTENIQLIYEGLKDMKISSEEIPVPASGKKVRKTPTTPRARSTPVKLLTSPPLTRSRSRDMRKFPSTPSSPRGSASRKNSAGDTDEIKDVRGRQRVKKM